MRMSGRARRMAEHHLRHNSGGELNLIPMIDILSVLVSFLLVYSTDVEVIQNSKGIEIPQSIAEEQPRQSVVVMITKDQLFVQGELVTTLAAIESSNDAVIEPLRDALKRPRLIGQDVAASDVSKREITVMADKAIPYEVLKKVMSTCTDADYGRISLAVLQKDQPAPTAGLQAS